MVRGLHFGDIREISPFSLFHYNSSPPVLQAILQRFDTQFFPHTPTPFCPIRHFSPKSLARGKFRRNFRRARLRLGAPPTFRFPPRPRETHHTACTKSLVILTERSEWKDLGTKLTANVTISAKIPRLAGARSGRHMGYMVRFPWASGELSVRQVAPPSSL